MFSYAKLQTAMTRLRFKDESVLRGVGLAKLSKTFDAYPLLEEGQKVYVLLPRGMDTAVAQKLNNTDAIKSVVVLSQTTSGVAKLWPNAEAVAAAQTVAQAPKPQAAPAEAALDFEIVEE